MVKFACTPFLKDKIKQTTRRNMSTKALTSIARRSSMLGVAVAVLAAAIIPAVAYADALNPLTERSLLLSSSAPGFQDTDGSGNSTDNQNAVNENYAAAGTGPNGKKTGQTFSFKVSTDSTVAGKEIKAFTLQYCTNAAGKCKAPGNNTGDARTKDRTTAAQGQTLDANNPDTWATRVADRGADTASTSDLNVNYGSDAVEGAAANFQVLVNNVPSTGWSLSTTNVETMTHLGELTGKQNFITLVNEAATVQPEAGQEVKIIFNASESKYITNPGSGSFFVKINTYDSTNPTHHVSNTAIPAEDNTHIIDGGVTVANVMTDSIHITTKVLETMSFSVGTQNPDTTTQSPHGTCQNIEQINNNRLQLGNPDAEYSLETSKTWDVNSYWRLSSNSSGGATVYYSGNTLANTVGDEIAEVGPAAQKSLQGTEQFGLGFVPADTDTFSASFEAAVSAQNSRFKYPTLLLAPAAGADPAIWLQPETAYANGTGLINTPEDPEEAAEVEEEDYAKFAFVKSSNEIPAVIAQNNEMVISCATAKMRYIANIGADTPAGVYTTKINYLAAPQY